jgi:hypothetical protein
MLTPELIAPARIEELLAGAVPDTDAEASLQGLMRQLRSSPTGAPDELRGRVRALDAEPPRSQKFSSRRRAALVFASLALAAIAASLVLGYPAGDGGLTHRKGTAVNQALRATPSPAVRDAETLARQYPSLLSGRTRNASGTAIDVDLWIELRVRDADTLSTAASDAMGITRELGGFVASSRVATQANEGRAELALRVPARKVDDALFRLTELGVVTSQRVATKDLQAGIDSYSRQADQMRRAIRIAQLRLASGTLGASDKLKLQIRIERLHGQRAEVMRTNARLAREAATAELTLVLHTQAPTDAGADKSGLAGTVGDALHVLGRAGAIGLYAAIVFSPLLVLALLIFLVRRRQLRNEEMALLDQSRPGVASPQPPQT